MTVRKRLFVAAIERRSGALLFPDQLEFSSGSLLPVACGHLVFNFVVSGVILMRLRLFRHQLSNYSNDHIVAKEVGCIE